MNTYLIHEDNIDRLESKLLRIQNKCEKYGKSFRYMRNLTPVFKTVKNEEGKDVTAKFFQVHVEGLARVDDWEFVATLEHRDAGNIIRKFATHLEVPKRYYDADAVCEHCKTHRNRKNTYIIHNIKTDEYMQVGATCLQDFTTGLSAEYVAGYIEMFDKMIEGEALPIGTGARNYYETFNLLKYAVQYTLDLGYTSTQSDNKSTKEYVLEAERYDSHTAMSYERESVEDYRRKFRPDYSSDELLQRVEAILAYFQEVEVTNDYLQTLRVIAECKYISYSEIGYLVSMVPTYYKAIERENEAKIRSEQAAKSQYVGEVGQRITINNPVVTVVSSWENAWGYTVRYRIVSEDNIYMWDTSAYIDSDKHLATITGTIKKHDTYREERQTWLTRCKFTYADNKDAV